MRCRILFTLMAFLITLSFAEGQPSAREKKVRDDKQKIETDGFWIYNDLPKAFAEAKATGKPLIVTLRCIPCEECVKLDDELVNTDPKLRPLLEKFVRVRIISTNGLDLSLFQYDTDQSFAVFLMNADKTIYGRFGTRSDKKNWVGDVSIAGMTKALEGALALHAEYPRNKESLAAKQGPAPEFPTPEKFPSLASTGRYTDKINYTGNVVQSCIHCHQIGDARKAFHRTKDVMPEEVVFPYPHPKAIGLILDPKERARVTEVKPGTLAEKAGFQTGDEILSMNGQPLLSMADVQWVFQQTPATGSTIKAEVQRDGKPTAVTLTLPAGWRRLDDISWRASSWTLRRMSLGGMFVESVPEEERKGGPALRVKFVGQYGPHAAANKAGVKAGDLIVSWDGKTDFTRESDLLAHGVLNHKAGDKIPVTLLRDGKKVDVVIPLQE